MQVESSHPARLSIQLFGDFRFAIDGQPALAIGAARLRSLLGYLALHSAAPQSRQHLAALLWPDTPEGQARNNLRQLIHQLRQTLPDADHLLLVDTLTIGWQPQMIVESDAVAFALALDEADAAERGHDQTALLDALQRAINLYGGDLLPSCYDEWIAPERERLHTRYIQTLARLVRLLEALGELDAAVGYAQALVRADPLDETAACMLIRLLMLNNDRAGALRIYHALVSALDRELGLDPGPAAYALYEQLLRSGEGPPRLPMPALLGAPTLVGRRQEWQQLTEIWQLACAGGPQAVLISGEAGIGKSRLAEELYRWAVQQGATVATARCYATEGQLALAPAIEWLRSERLQAQLALLGPVWRVEVARVLPELALTLPDLGLPAPISEYGQRQRFFEALARAILIAPPPLLLILDDLQWCDQETLEWLHILLRFDPNARLLVAATVRDGEFPARHPAQALVRQLQHDGNLTEIVLNPLDAAETARLAAQIAGRELDVSSALRLYLEAEGNPLFVVEMVRAGAVAEQSESAAPRSLPSAEHALPAPIQAVIAGRLAQLSERALAIARLAAAIGREFRHELLVSASGMDETQIVEALDELWHSRIIREQGVNRYDFSHDKLREVAYDQIAAPQRRLVHRRIAQALEHLYMDDLDSLAGQIAVHYERAGMATAALDFYQRAMIVARRIYANEDAITLVIRALALIEQLPTGRLRDAQELQLQLTLAAIYRATRGWTAPELELALDRTRILCERVGDDDQRAQLLYGLQGLYVVQARFDQVLRVSSELYQLYGQSFGNQLPLFGFVSQAGALLHLGRIAESSKAFNQIITTHNQSQWAHFEEQQGWSYAIHARAWQAHTLWCQGQPGLALRRAYEALELADDLRQPFNRALATAYLAMLLQMTAPDDLARAAAEQALAIATQYRIPYYRAWARILVYYAEAARQPNEDAITQLRGAITDFTATGARLRLPYYDSLLVRALQGAGYFADGLAVVDIALAAAFAQQERWWDSELYRLRAELLGSQGADAALVQNTLLHAIEIAYAQGSLALELRALTSLVRLQPETAMRDHLVDLLDQVGAETDTPDLQAARAALTP